MERKDSAVEEDKPVTSEPAEVAHSEARVRPPLKLLDSNTHRAIIEVEPNPFIVLE